MAGDEGRVAEAADRDYVMAAESEPDDEATLEEEERAARLDGGDAEVMHSSTCSRPGFWD